MKEAQGGTHTPNRTGLPILRIVSTSDKSDSLRCALRRRPVRNTTMPYRLLVSKSVSKSVGNLHGCA